MLLVLALGWNQAAAAVEAADHSESAARLRLTEAPLQAVSAEFASYWIETEHMADVPRASHWQPVEYATITAGPQSRPVWFRVPVVNATRHTLERKLEVRWLNIDGVDFYLQRASGREHQFLGFDDPRGLVPVPGSSYEFSLTLLPGEQADLLFRVSTQYFSFLPLYIWEPDAYATQQRQVHGWYLLGFGALLSLLFYNLSLGILVRDRAYLLYCAYVVSILIYELAFNGMGNAYLWQGSVWLHKNGLGLGIYLSFLAGTLFFREFLNIGAYSLWLQRMVDASLLYWVVALLALFAFDRFFQSSIYMSMIVCVFALGGSLYLWYLGNPLAKVYLLAWAALLFFTVLMLLMITGIVSHHPLTEHGQMIGFVTEMVLLSFALATRIKLERDQREQAQQQALRLQLDINRERENTIEAQQQVLLLEKQNNQVLEQRVAERTLELQEALGHLSAANEELARLTVTDPLTGAANRRHFDEVLDQEIQRAARTRQPLSLILIDIDHFKQLNDQHGHIAGDECLKRFADLLQTMINRTTDLVARYGGEEFAIILPQTHQEAAFTVAEKVRLAVAAMGFSFKGQVIPITVSLGVVGLQPQPGMSVTDFVDAADNALYAAKHTGRNRSVLAQAVS
ncbi:MAG: GGDEF domain-containing protein [Ketobacter sp.]|nr:MAG: GGDEF domain-containing protein [Ketobacter sp.]